ncbi:MAG TPA: hypothetical protein PKC65_01680 [Pyrinomonadaceae bacterium]|nr:hypothetical protein [Pyrinomonadaceae bacterium]
MTDIAEDYGAKETVKVKGEKGEKSRKIKASSTSEAVEGQYKMVVFESKNIGDNHVMRQDVDGTWSSKDGGGSLVKGIKDPEAYYGENFNDPNAKITYFYRGTDKLGQKK